MYEFLEYRVSDAMVTDPVVITKETMLRDVEEIFEHNDFNMLPVVDDGRLAGIVTKLDLLAAFDFRVDSIVPHYEEVMRQPAASAMNASPVTVPPDRPLTHVLNHMVETRWRSFPVLDGQRLVGIVSRRDVLNALRRAAGR
jgi:CBS domain-containing protein